jgi:hypothetical protein
LNSGSSSRNKWWASGYADHQHFFWDNYLHVPQRPRAAAFHVFYQGNEAKIDIENLEIMAGYLARRALGLVLDWAELYQSELRDNWTLAQQRKPIKDISPLE